MDRHKLKIEKRRKRHMHVRHRVVGEPERPRLSVFRSLKHIYAQVIDDMGERTLLSASTLSPELEGKVEKSWNRSAAREVGKLLARKAAEAGISKVAFDRGPYRYHGRVKELAEGAREGGLQL